MPLRIVYIVLMLIAGVALALASLVWPAIASGQIPPLLWLLLVSLVIDVTAMAIAATRGAMPIEMSTRFVGFLGAAGLYLLITTLRAGA